MSDVKWQKLSLTTRTLNVWSWVYNNNHRKSMMELSHFAFFPPLHSPAFFVISIFPCCQSLSFINILHHDTWPVVFLPRDHEPILGCCNSNIIVSQSFYVSFWIIIFRPKMISVFFLFWLWILAVTVLFIIQAQSTCQLFLFQQTVEQPRDQGRKQSTEFAGMISLQLLR